MSDSCPSKTQFRHTVPLPLSLLISTQKDFFFFFSSQSTISCIYHLPTSYKVQLGQINKNRISYKRLHTVNSPYWSVTESLFFFAHPIKSSSKSLQLRVCCWESAVENLLLRVCFWESTAEFATESLLLRVCCWECGWDIAEENLLLRVCYWESAAESILLSLLLRVYCLESAAESAAESLLLRVYCWEFAAESFLLSVFYCESTMNIRFVIKLYKLKA